MSKVCYLPSANRSCTDCGCTKAVPEAVARRVPALGQAILKVCERCGDDIELDVHSMREPLRNHLKESYVPRCDECCSEASLASCEINLPDGMGRGYVYLCGVCVARYDEGHASWAH